MMLTFMLSGDIEYRISDGEGYGTLEDVPLLVGFNVGRGRVVFSSFHWRSQNPTQANQLMLVAVEGLNPVPMQTFMEMNKSMKRIARLACLFWQWAVQNMAIPVKSKRCVSAGSS